MTVFHSRLWIETLLKAFPRWRDASRLIHLPDGRDVWLPLLETDRIGAWCWLDAMPSGFFGGPLVADGHLTASDMKFILQEAGAQAGWLSINFDPLDAPANSGKEMVPITTHLLTLNEDFDSVERGFSKMVRRHVRHAVKQGVVTRRGQGAADFTAYFGLTQIATQRWKLEAPPFPLPLYQALATLPPEHVSLWLAEYDERPVGGLISIHYAPGRAYYWASAMNPDYAHLNPTKLLQWEAIREACQRGAAVYNMGPSAGFDSRPLEGVRQAKEALGARPFDYSVILLMRPWAMRFRALRNRVRHLLQR